MEIVVLVENEPAGDGKLRSEHGLSLLVLAHGRRVLFDTGASGAVVGNADRLGLGDALAELDAIVPSHGHSDHTGGLAAVLARTRRPTPVHLRPGCSRPRLSTRGGVARAIGVPFAREELEMCGARLVEETGPREILPGFWLTGEIPLREETSAGEACLHLGATLADAVPDPFTDEQALVVAAARGLVVLVGCAHRGIVNSLAAAREVAGGGDVHAVLGGAHLRAADEARSAWSAERVRQLVGHAALGHCTGQAAEARFAAVFGNNFHPLRTGWRWNAA
jgi:7,8-dihydropterin-6-yl-methyl-4-(beta-D-ribofuranosyl)aminobenzene 5'-phosphate synthase